jgi:hypothetical protein
VQKSCKQTTTTNLATYLVQSNCNLEAVRILDLLNDGLS